MSLTFDAPAMSVSVPRELGWHMILDHELDQLSHSEMGFIGSLGFVGLGAALGLIPQVVDLVIKLFQTPIKSQYYPFDLIYPRITTLDIGSVAAFVFSLAIAIICLAISGLFHRRNKKLAAAIRSRGKQGIPPLKVV